MLFPQTVVKEVVAHAGPSVPLHLLRHGTPLFMVHFTISQNNISLIATTNRVAALVAGRTTLSIIWQKTDIFFVQTTNMLVMSNPALLQVSLRLPISTPQPTSIGNPEATKTSRLPSEWAQFHALSLFPEHSNCMAVEFMTETAIIKSTTLLLLLVMVLKMELSMQSSETPGAQAGAKVATAESRSTPTTMTVGSAVCTNSQVSP